MVPSVDEPNMDVLCGLVEGVHLHPDSIERHEVHQPQPICCNCGEVGHSSASRGCRHQSTSRARMAAAQETDPQSVPEPSQSQPSPGGYPDYPLLRLLLSLSKPNASDKRSEDAESSGKYEESREDGEDASDGRENSNAAEDEDDCEKGEEGAEEDSSSNVKVDDLREQENKSIAGNSIPPHIYVTRLFAPGSSHSHISAIKSKLGRYASGFSLYRQGSLEVRFTPRDRHEYQVVIKYLDSIEGTPGEEKYVINPVNEPAVAVRGPLSKELDELKRRKNRAIREYSAWPSQENKKILRALCKESKEKIAAFRATEREAYE